MHRLIRALGLILVVIALAACEPTSAEPETTAPQPADTTSPPPTTVATATTGPSTTTSSRPTTTTAAPITTTLPPGVTAAPDWIGTRVLPERPDGFGVAQETPPEMLERRFVTVDVLPPPEDGEFAATISEVPEHVIARSTWKPDCPVALDELRYVTVTFWGFDGRPHTGELILNARVAEDVAGVFATLFAERFPIEEMRVVTAEELDEPPTGDGNNTTAFSCRPAVGSGSWSQHAYGLAVDVNPFHNPYRKGDLILPELSSAYLDRDDVRPGMILADGPVVAAFTDIGWGWGGWWTTLSDLHHFSENGR